MGLIHEAHICILAVFQILAHHPTTHILVCAASNSSADLLARYFWGPILIRACTDYPHSRRLSLQLAPDVLFRLNDSSRCERQNNHSNGSITNPSLRRTMEEVRLDMHRFCYSEDGHWALPPIQ